MAYDDRYEQRLIDKLSDQSWLDRVPLMPQLVIGILGGAMGINAAVSLFTDYDSPWWVGFPLLIAFFLLILRAARADNLRKATTEAGK